MKEKPLYKQIADDISTDIFSKKLRAGDRVPSERDLMQQYMVSQMTTKNALNELASKNYIIRIKGKGSFVNNYEALIESGYIDDKTADKVRQQKIIGLILPAMKTKVEQELIDNIEFYTQKMGYNLILKISRELQESETTSIKELRVIGAEGIIIFPVENELYNSEILKLALENFPLVFVDRYLQGIKVCSITTDNYHITKEAIVDMMKNKAKNIAFISPNSENSVTNERLSGFNDAFSDNPVELTQTHQLMIDLEVKDSQKKEEILYNFISMNKEVDGFFCVNNELATLLLHVLERHFPYMIKNSLLYAFDASDLPHFTHIQQDSRMISKLAVNKLSELISGDASKEHISIPAKIIHKQS